MMFECLKAVFTNRHRITIFKLESIKLIQKAAEMTYIKIKFGSNFEDEFQKAVDEVFHLVRPAFKNYKCIWHPNIDVYESVEEVIVLADMRDLIRKRCILRWTGRKLKSRASAKQFNFA